MKCQVPLALPKSIQLSFLDVSVAAAVFVRTDGRNFVAYKVSAAYIMNYEKL